MSIEPNPPVPGERHTDPITPHREFPAPPFVDRSGDRSSEEIAAAARTVFRKRAIAVLLFLAVLIAAGTMGSAGIIVQVAMVITVLALGGGYMIASRSAGALEKSRWITGSSTPYQDQYSQQQALVMQGLVNEALASYEGVIAGPESTIDARRRAAELYAGSGGNPGRAAELFREILAHPAARAGDHVYAANRLADLYTGPLNQPGKAMGVLRQLIDRYPASAGAENARAALRALKAGSAERE